MGSTRNRGGGLDLAGAFSQFSPVQEDEETRRKLEEMLRGGQQPTRKGLFGSGFADKLGDLGSALMSAQAGIDGDFATSEAIFQNIGAARKKAIEDARKRQQDREDFVWQLDERAKREGPAIELREDNAGNMWRFDKRTGRQLDERPVFTDRATRTIMGPDGQMITVPNPYLDQEPPPAPVGRLTPLTGGGAGNGAGNFHIPSGNPLDPYWRRRRR